MQALHAGVEALLVAFTSVEKARLGGWGVQGKGGVDASGKQGIGHARRKIDVGKSVCDSHCGGCKAILLEMGGVVLNGRIWLLDISLVLRVCERCVH